MAEAFAQLKTDSAALEQHASNYSSNSMSVMELAACTAKLVNECARITNELSANMGELIQHMNMYVENGELVMEVGV